MDDPIYIIKDAPNRGRGMFAARDIKRGECIIAESPLLYARNNSSMTGNTAAVEALSKKNKKYFYALHNARADEGIPQDFGIIKTNALPLGPGATDGAVYRIISRINHSCAPNVTYSWNSRTKKEYVYAIKDIPEGNEILTSYLLPFMTRAERQEGLQTFRFTCRCEICDVDSSEEHDAILKRISQCSDLIKSYVVTNPRKSIGHVREALALIDKIGGNGKTSYYHDAYQICAIYSNFDLAQEWADLQLESCRIEEGEEGVTYARFLAYSRNPKSHPQAGYCRFVDLTGA